MWWIFFFQFSDIGGWQFRDLSVLMAIGSLSYGLRQIFFGGIKNISRYILTGGLDALMTQPKNILLHLLWSKSQTKGWGNIFTGIFVVCFSGLTDFYTLSMITICMFSGCMLFVSVSIISHSLVFWLGPVESLANRYCDSLYLFALYPSNVYSGFLKLLMFTALPAGFIGYLPVELVKNFTWENLIYILFASSSFTVFSFWLFFKGLVCYESGNQIGVQA